MQDYYKHFGFIRNKAISWEIESLDPAKDHCRIVYLTTGYEFPWDMVRALEVALMKTFCSPRISELLHRTGKSGNMAKKDMMIPHCWLQNLCKTDTMVKEAGLLLSM